MPNRSKKSAKKSPGSRLTVSKNGYTEWLTIDQIRAYTGCSVRTAQTWRRDPASIPRPMLELLEIKALGLMPGFEGARLVDGAIHLDNGHRLNLGHLEWFAFQGMRARYLERVNDDLKARIEQLEDHIDRLTPVSANENKFQR